MDKYNFKKRPQINLSLFWPWKTYTKQTMISFPFSGRSSNFTPCDWRDSFSITHSGFFFYFNRGWRRKASSKSWALAKRLQWNVSTIEKFSKKDFFFHGNNEMVHLSTIEKFSKKWFFFAMAKTAAMKWFIFQELKNFQKMIIFSTAKRLQWNGSSFKNRKIFKRWLFFPWHFSVPVLQVHSWLLKGARSRMNTLEFYI